MKQRHNCCVYHVSQHFAKRPPAVGRGGRQNWSSAEDLNWLIESLMDSWTVEIEGGRRLQLQIHGGETKRRHRRGREEVEEKGRERVRGGVRRDRWVEVTITGVEEEGKDRWRDEEEVEERRSRYFKLRW